MCAVCVPTLWDEGAPAACTLDCGLLIDAIRRLTHIRVAKWLCTEYHQQIPIQQLVLPTGRQTSYKKMESR